MLDLTAMRPAAPLAPAFGSLKPDHRRKLRPVDRIKPFVLRGGSALSVYSPSPSSRLGNAPATRCLHAVPCAPFLSASEPPPRIDLCEPRIDLCEPQPAPVLRAV